MIKKTVYFGMRMSLEMKLDIKELANKDNRLFSNYVEMVLKKHIEEKKLDKI